MFLIFYYEWLEIKLNNSIFHVRILYFIKYICSLWKLRSVHMIRFWMNNPFMKLCNLKMIGYLAYIVYFFIFLLCNRFRWFRQIRKYDSPLTLNWSIQNFLEYKDFRISKVKTMFVIANIIKRVCSEIIFVFNTWNFEGCIIIYIIIQANV